MLRFASDVSQLLVDAFMPDACLVCGRSHDRSLSRWFPLDRLRGAACAAVASPRFPYLKNHPLCPCCAAELVVAPAVRVRGLEVVAAFRTNETLLRAIHRVKFAGYPILLSALSASLAMALVGAAPPVEVIVPVPMDRAALRRRGFNQSDVIARHIGAELRLPVFATALGRRAGSRQSLLSAGARARNARRVFHVRAGGCCGARVLLVDDLVTTGSTAGVCAALLRGAGATGVTIAALGVQP